MAAKAEEHRTAVEAPDPAVRAPAEHCTGGGREEEVGPREKKRKRRRCVLELDKEVSSRGSGSFSFDTRCAWMMPIETTPKFGSFNSSADLAAKGRGRAAEEGEEGSGDHREFGGSGESKDGT